MNVLMISPGFPNEMQYFTRGLAAVIHGGKSVDEALEIAGLLVRS